LKRIASFPGGPMRMIATGFPPKVHSTGVRAPVPTSTRSPNQRPPALASKSRYVVALPSGRAKRLMTRGIEVPGSGAGPVARVQIGKAAIWVESPSNDVPAARSMILVVDGRSGTANATSCSSLDHSG
jgi:hypothetical protein